jgi:hypothetical protein
MKIIRRSNHYTLVQYRATKKQKRKGAQSRYYTIELTSFPLTNSSLKDIRSLIDPNHVYSKSGMLYTFQDLLTAEKRFNLLVLTE